MFLSLLFFRLITSSASSMQSSLYLLVGLSAGLTQAYTVTTSELFMYKNIDPIIYPGQYDKSHMHSFFGSDAVTINTTTSAELQQGCSTTENPNDYSIYCTLQSHPSEFESRLAMLTSCPLRGTGICRRRREHHHACPLQPFQRVLRLY